MVSVWTLTDSSWEPVTLQSTKSSSFDSNIDPESTYVYVATVHYECWSAHTLPKQKLVQISFCQMAFKLNPEWIVVNCKPFNGLLCSRLTVLFLSEKRCVTSRTTAAKETSPSIAAPMFRLFLPQGDLYLQHSLSQRRLCRHSSKIVHHRDALAWKKRNMKIRFCRRILDISGRWLFRQPPRTQHQERHKFAYRTMRKFCTLCKCFFYFRVVRSRSGSFHNVKWPVLQNEFWRSEIFFSAIHC